VPSAFVYPAENILQNQDTNATATNPSTAIIAPTTTTATNTLNPNGNATASGNFLSYNNIAAQQQQHTQQPQFNPTASNNLTLNNPNNLQQCQPQLPCELSSQDDLRYHGTELVMLYDYKAQAPDDLSARRGEIIYADLNNQTVEGWLWAYAPKASKKCGRYGFIPKSYTHTYNRQNTSV
jgi:hypothetical protein